MDMNFRADSKLHRLQFGGSLKAIDCPHNGTRIDVVIQIREDGGADFEFTRMEPENFGNDIAPKGVYLSA